ncbi:CDP-diacylglycerol--serine O-phosphatidyltransferase [Candidatus Woesearchaeota archaeon]|nr:CDP-diacylglycerol--serine O-phosphatidyltransferase [Candidatus Woesearchaeota archaeon]
MFRLIEFPHVLTLMNILCGMISVLFAISGELKLAAVFMLAAVFFDFIDGRIARYMDKVTVIGKELDSLCDIVSFGVAPVVFAFQTTKDIGEGWIFAAIIYMVFLAAGALRLARFNVKELHYFEGMPITLNGVVVPLFYFFGLTSWYPFIFLVAAILMISAFRIKKFI